MAERDKSQGIGFVYVDLKKLLAERDTVYKHPIHPQAATAKMINLNRDRGPVVETVVKGAVKPAAVSKLAAQPAQVSLKQIKENLDRLQALHHKLHAVLEELNTVADSSKDAGRKDEE